MTPALIPDYPKPYSTLPNIYKTVLFIFQSFSKTETNLLLGLSYLHGAVSDKYQYTFFRVPIWSAAYTNSGRGGHLPGTYYCQISSQGIW